MTQYKEDPSTLAEVRRLWDEGYRMTFISKKLNVTMSTVSVALHGFKRKDAKVNGEDLIKIFKAREEGYTLAEIGIEYGITRERVRQLLLKPGKKIERLKPYKKVLRTQALNKKKTEKIRALAMQGCTTREISAKIKCSKTTVRRLAKEGGVKIPRYNFTNTLRLQITALADGTSTGAQIARELGIDPSLVGAYKQRDKLNILDGRCKQPGVDKK